MSEEAYKIILTAFEEGRLSLNDSIQLIKAVRAKDYYYYPITYSTDTLKPGEVTYKNG